MSALLLNTNLTPSCIQTNWSLALVAFFSILTPRLTDLEFIGAPGAAGLKPGDGKEDSTMRAVCFWPKSVSVIAYFRFRFGRWESVRTHCRSYPAR